MKSNWKILKNEVHWCCFIQPFHYFRRDLTYVQKSYLKRQRKIGFNVKNYMLNTMKWVRQQQYFDKRSVKLLPSPPKVIFFPLVSFTYKRTQHIYCHRTHTFIEHNLSAEKSLLSIANHQFYQGIFFQRFYCFIKFSS